MKTWTDEVLVAPQVHEGVRERDRETARLDAFCGAACVFAVTILIISTGGVPRSHADLMFALRDAPAFAVSFLAIGSFWNAHRHCGERYGLMTTSPHSSTWGWPS